MTSHNEEALTRDQALALNHIIDCHACGHIAYHTADIDPGFYQCVTRSLDGERCSCKIQYIVEAALPIVEHNTGAHREHGIHPWESMPHLAL